MTVWKIAVCDDDAYVHQEVAALLAQCASPEAFRLYCFTTGTDLVQYSQSEMFDLIYLDIQMPGMDGVETARMLRQCGCQAAIIFLTNFDDYLEVGYEVQAFRYRFKPLRADLFQKDFCSWQQWYQSHSGQSIRIETIDGVHQVAVQDIIYLEIVKRKVQIVTTDGVLLAMAPMSHWEQLLGNAGFVSPYNKILVNERHIKFFDQTKVLVTGNVSLPMSRRKYGDFCKTMMKRS